MIKPRIPTLGTTLILVSLCLCACAPQANRSSPDAGDESVELAPSSDAVAPDEPRQGTDRADTSGAQETDGGRTEIASKPPSTFLAPVARLIGIGDIHGDIQALRGALLAAQVIDTEDHWSGGTTVVVQVGDQLDRGDDEREILHWLETLAGEALAAGGAVYPLLGNHEAMNVDLDLRYVTQGGFADFADVPWAADDPLYASYEEAERGRVAAFRPGGPYASLLASHFITVMVGETVFVHGGIVPSHVAYGLDAINGETSDWMNGDAPEPGVLSGSDSPVWSRHYSDSPDADDCMLLFETLEALDAKRMVVAHTVQSGGISDACGGKVWRVDVGLADYYGGPTQVLLIEGDQVTVLP
jgi:hypothetical protein